MIAAGAAPAAAPRTSAALSRLFAWYSRGYLARHFHAVRLSGGEPVVPGKLPVVIFLNHGSWWDPLVSLLLAEHFFKDRPRFAPIDAEALRRYRFLEKVGFFGVDIRSTRGGVDFLRASLGVLSRPEAMLWLTPEGAFTDPRKRPLAFKPGLGHLAARLPRAVFVPLAIEYGFWTERTPEILVRFGEPILNEGHPWSADDWSTYFERNLTSTMNALARDSMSRERELFQTLLEGRAGVGMVYDGWRALRAWVTGKPFSREHA